MTTNSSEKILIVENDPGIGDLIARQALKPYGYNVSLAVDGASAIRQAIQLQPDVIITNLNLPGLSGKDLLVALSSQNLAIPTIVMAEKGQEGYIIQAFRLGASDCLILPVREAEVVACVERALKQVRELKAREALDNQIRQTNTELQRRVRELGIIFSVGRAVISITDQRVLFDKIIEAVTTVTEADLGWLTIKDESSKNFVLVAHRKLPEALAKKIGQPIEDGLGTLVAMSAETLAINGQPLQKFMVSSLGKSAMVVPIKIKNEAIGLMTVVRKADNAFGTSEHTLAEAIADYASISMVNARLFRALAKNAEAAQTGEKRYQQLLLQMNHELQASLKNALQPLDALLGEKMGPITPQQRQSLEITKQALKRLVPLVNQQETPSKS